MPFKHENKYWYRIGSAHSFSQYRRISISAEGLYQSFTNGTIMLTATRNKCTTILLYDAELTTNL